MPTAMQLAKNAEKKRIQDKKTQQQTTAIRKLLRDGHTVDDLLASGKWLRSAITRAVNLHALNAPDDVRCRCGAKCTRVNAQGYCLACEVRPHAETMKGMRC